jgi:S1-C subfamily serine protease
MRIRIIILALWIYGLFPLVASQASDFSSAQNSFQRLPDGDRHTLTMALIATGFYNGMSTGEFNHRIFNGIIQFQIEHAQQPTGILGETEKQTLLTESAKFLQTIGLREVYHPLVSAKLFVPFKLISTETRTPKGLSYEGDDAAVDFSFYPPTELALVELFNRLSIDSNARRITYKLLRNDFFVVAGDFGGRHFYSRFSSIAEGNVGFTFSWNDVAAGGHGDRVAALVSNLFFGVSAASLSVGNSERSPRSALALPKGQVWIVLASRQKLEDAIEFASRYGSQSVRVARSMNDWFAVIEGPTDTDDAHARIDSGGFVEPPFLSHGERLIQTVWERPKAQVATNAPVRQPEIAWSGSSVFISQEGYLVTNEHVVAGCTSLNAIGIGQVSTVAQDTTNDLALLKTNTGISAEPLPLSTRATRLGQEVIAVGYPLRGILGGLNVTNGIVSGLSGLGNNSARLQFTAPIQPGNSGGALLDRSGALVGIVSSKLNDQLALKGGFVPQGVNFAVREEVVRAFLSTQSVRPPTADASSERSIEDIAELARKSVFPIECLK